MSFIRGQASETKQEGYHYYIRGVYKLKKASFIPVSVEKSTCIIYPKVGLKQGLY